MLSLWSSKMQHSISLPPFWQVQLFFFSFFLLMASVWTIIQQICQCTSSGSNICLLSIVERAWHCFILDSVQFQILYPTPKKRRLLRIHKLSLMGSCRHKQLFWVALHLLWVLLISSWFTLVIYDTVTFLFWITYRLQIQLGGVCLHTESD